MSGDCVLSVFCVPQTAFAQNISTHSARYKKIKKSAKFFKNLLDLFKAFCYDIKAVAEAA